MPSAFVAKFDQPPFDYSLRYSAEHYTIFPEWIGSEPPPVLSGCSLCSKTIIFELGLEGEIVSCSGYLPAGGWIPAHKSIPVHRPGRLCFSSYRDLIPGVCRTVPGTDSWVALAVIGTNWVYFGVEPSEAGAVVQIANGLLGCLHRDVLTGIWMSIEVSALPPHK
jgi:hypothetical protein